MFKGVLNKISIPFIIAFILLFQLVFGAGAINVYAQSQDIRIEFYNSVKEERSDSLNLCFKITNKGNTQIGLSKIKLRYYFDDDGVSPIGMNPDYAHNNYAHIPNDRIIYSANDIISPDANKYIEIGFNTAAGILAPDTSAGINLRVWDGDYNQKFDQTNDYSFCAKNTTYAPWDKIALYVDDTCVSGIEPVVSVPSVTNTPPPTVKPTTIQTPPPMPSATEPATPTPTPVSSPGVSPRPKVTMPPEQLLKNGDFEDGMKYWNYSSNNTSGAEASNIVVSDPFGDMWSVTDISRVGSDYWSIQLMQGDFELDGYSKYKITFDASSTVPRDIRFVIRNQKNYTGYFASTQKIDSKMKTYSYEFLFNQPSAQEAQIVFSMGSFENITDKDHKIHLDNIILEKISSITDPEVPTEPPKPDEHPGIIFSRECEDEIELGDSANITISSAGELLVDGSLDDEKEIIMVIDNSGALNSYMEETLTPLDFGIYSNNNISMTGDFGVVNGSVHANGEFGTWTSRLKITNTCSATDFYISTPDLNVGELVNIDTPIDMPRFHSELISEATASLMVFDPKYFLHGIHYPMTGQKNVNISFNYFENRFEITGGGVLNIDSSVYFKSNVLISLNETKNINEAFIVADGDITIEGLNLSPKGPYDRLYLYSIHGNIKFATTNSEINGLIYAPGNPSDPSSGNVEFIGSKNIINGTIVGNDLSFTASDLKVNHLEGQFTSVEEKYFENTSYLASIQEAANSFIDRFAGSKTRVSVIEYSDSANNNDFTLFDMSSGNGVKAAKKSVNTIVPGTSGHSNMGDALRRAYHILNNSPRKKARKYIVVLAGSVPNRWTGTSSMPLGAKFDNGNALFIKTDGASYDSLDYAKDIGGLIRQSDIKPVFVNFTPVSIEGALGEIAEVAGAQEVGKTGKHFYAADDYPGLLDIFDCVYAKITNEIKLDDVLYEEIIPLGVRILEVPEWMTLETFKEGGITRYKLKATINNIPLSFNGAGYDFSIGSFKIKAEFLKPGDIIFKEEDSRILFKIDYIDRDGKNKTEIIEKHPEAMKVRVTMDIDIT